MALLPITQVHAEYYNNALAPAYRTTPIKMENATDTKKTGSVVTSIKHQGDTGTCWAFSTDAAAETSLMTQLQKAGITPKLDQFDFSEKYTAWMMFALSKDEVAKKQTHVFYAPTMNMEKVATYPQTEPSKTAFSNLSQGGTIYNDIATLMGNFIVDETGKPQLKFYGAKADAAKNIVDAVVSPTYKAHDIYTKWGINNKLGIDSTSQLSQLQKYKDLLKANGSLRVDYYSSGQVNHDTGSLYASFVPTKYNPETKKDEPLSTDHAILVVGYDDDYDFSKDTGIIIQPPGKGAWIVKNSWGVGVPGDKSGDAGFYYLSYYDKMSTFSSAVVMEPDIARYTITDTRTPVFVGQTLTTSNPTVASTYKPTENQFLKAVSFLTNSDGASYTIEIVRNSKDPSSKAIYSQTGTFSGANEMSGYHTVDLNKFILLPRGEDYLIRITTIGNKGTETINVVFPEKDNPITNIVYANNKSFYKYSGQWLDANKESQSSIILNGQSKQTNLANGGDFTVGSLGCDKASNVVINLGKADEAYTTDLLFPNRKTLSNMTADIGVDGATKVPIKEDFWGTIKGEGSVTKTGAGELSFCANNTYTGDTNVNQGILNNYASTESKADVKNGAIYRILNLVSGTIKQRGIYNEGKTFIVADKKGIINFSNTSDYLSGSDKGIWYLNTLDPTNKRKTTNGTISIGANTDNVKGEVYIEGGSINCDQTKFFDNATIRNKNKIKINFRNQAPLLSSSSPLMKSGQKQAASIPLSTISMGKMVVEGTTEVDIDTLLAPSTLRTDLVKGRVINEDGTDDNTPNKVKLGFTLDNDVTFTDAAKGVSSSVIQGQMGKVVNNSAFAINRGGATGSYNISYNYDATAQEGILNIVNAVSPTSLQDALTSTVTSKYYAPGADQVLSDSWNANLSGNDLTLAGDNTIIDGNKKTQVFNVAKDKMLNLNDVSVIQGKGTAIHNEGNLSLSSANSDVNFSQNEGTEGGAIYNKNELVLSTLGNNTKFQNNTAANGAAIYNDTDSAINTPSVDAAAYSGDLVFENNEATANGGAIHNKSDLSLWANGGNVQLTNNQAQNGAGVYNTGYLSVYATDKAVEFNKNIATANGGAVLNDGGYVDILAEGGSVNFSQNQAQNGGAIHNTNTVGAISPVVVNITAETGNITFDGNIASNKGGAIYNTETMNIAALENQTIAFRQSTDSIYNTGNINFNHNGDYDQTQGLISTGAQLGGAGTYNLYGGELAFVKATNNPAVVGSISHESTLSIINDSILNLANGIKETFDPGTLKIANTSTLYVAIDCILKGKSSEADVLDAGIYNGGSSQIVIEAVNLIKSSDENQASYRIKIAGTALESAIAENVMAEIAGYRSAYSSQTGDLLLLSEAVKGLVDYVASTESKRIYSMTQDELAIFPLGNMGGENSTLTIEGNNNKIVSEFSDIDGITVSSTNTLNVNNVSFDNFKTAITNKGFLNLNNVAFNGQVGANIYDVNNSSIMTLQNNVSGRVLNSGVFIPRAQNDLSDLTLRSIDGSILDLRNTTNDVNLKALSIAGNVDLYLNGVNKLSATTASRDALTDSLVIQLISQITSSSTTVTDTNDLKPFIKIADNATFTLADSAKPVGAYSGYKLTYSDTTGKISVNGIDLNDTTTKSGSINVESSANFTASATNTVAADKAVTLNGPKSGLAINLSNDTTVSGTFGLNNLTLNGNKLALDNNDKANLNFTNSTLNNKLELNGGETQVINSSLNGDIKMANTAVLSFDSGTNTVNGAISGTAGSELVVNAPTMFNNTVDPVTETVNSLAIHNANVSQVDFMLNNGGQLAFTKDSYLNNDNTNSLNFNGGSLNLMNGVASTIRLQAMDFASATNSPVVSNMYVDVDLANKTMDKLDANTINVGTGSTLNVAGMRLLSDAKEDNTSINFTKNNTLQGIVMTTTSEVAYSPIYKYLVDYNSSNGNFDFARSLNPAILASSVAAQVGSYLTQLNSYDQAFGNMDMMMSMTNQQRQAMKFANKYAAAGSGNNLMTFSPNQIPEQDAGLWFKPYATFETVGLKNGPTVGNVAYGSFFGGDTPIIELKNGWDAVFTGYAGYNGSHQTYDGVGIYQSGGTVGATGVFYKGNFFTGLTANVGANVAEANTMFGQESIPMLATGIASKTGYNFEMAEGKFIIQPNFLMSYSFINTFNYTNAAGVDISSQPLNAIQIAPGIRFIGNLKNGWQPYALVQMVWNIMDQSRFTANDVSLPELSVKPYIQYGIGLQKRWGERFTGYGQAVISSGGRNGVGFQLGFRWALGKGPKNSIGAAGKTLTSEKAMPKKCNISLQSFKSDEQI